MTAQAAPASGWLSPSRAWRLLKCPASVGCQVPVDGGVYSNNDRVETNAGTLAHSALERWIRTSGYQCDNPGVVLADAADACLADLGAAAPPGWTLVRARLLARGAALAELLGRRRLEDIASEVELTDAVIKLRGTPDLVLLGSESILLDLKTQTIRGNVPEWVAFQLNLYAHLVSAAYGRRPDSVEIFSLNRGRVPVEITEQSIQTALAGLEAARASTGGEARPGPDVCFFCNRRFSCQAHWDVAVAWHDSDCVEGVIKRFEVAASGFAAVLVDGSAGETWVSGIPEQKISAGKTGDRIRLVRLRRAVAAAEGQDNGWRWRNVSDLQLVSAEAQEPGS